MSRYLLATLGCVAAGFVACSSRTDGNNTGSEANLGQVSLNVAAAPSDVHCVAIQAANSTRSVTRNIDVTPGQSITTTVNGLPTGTVTVSALAYPAACSALTASSVATWASDPQSQTISLAAGTVVPLNLVLRPSGAIAPSIDWQGDGAGGAGAGGSTSSGGSTGTGGSTQLPGGWWTSWKTEGWHGCPWAAIDTAAGTTTSITPTDVSAIANGGPYHVSGTVAGNSSYSAFAMFGFNLGQSSAGASCAYDPTLMTKTGTPGVTMPSASTGIALNIAYLKAVPQIRVQLMGPNAATDANSRWCQIIPTLSSPVFLKFTDFYTSCWGTDAASKGTAYSGQPISSISFIVPGITTAIPYDFVVNGFAAGTSAADAPTGGTSTSLTGTIGGAGTTDLDAQRVKVTKSGQDYIIQNNNFGNPSGSDQTLSYTDNSFRVVSSTGTGSSTPASFPSIFIGSNGTTSTKATDNLPKQVSTIASVQTTMTWTGTCGSGFNAAYDVWFASAVPAASYNDAISGFMMIWLCKPSDRQPLGSVQRTVTLAGQTWDVWVGTRGGSGANANAPVVSFVKQGTALNTLTFNLKDFITNAATNGIQSSWYLTDVFSGFQIWTGSSATNLSVSNFTCAVQ